MYTVKHVFLRWIETIEKKLHKKSEASQIAIRNNLLLHIIQKIAQTHLKRSQENRIDCMCITMKIIIRTQN